MKKLILIVVYVVVMNFQPDAHAQDTIITENRTVIYSFFINIVPDQFNVPLIGFVNLAGGSHESVHVGFVNVNQKDFIGLQTSFINTAGGSVEGAQVGFINTAGKSMEGAQVGFVNTVASDAEAAQIGFVNTVARNMEGAQIGFVNTTTSGMEGPQIGFVNGTGKLNGFQLGFVNYADTLEQGIPVGFVSIIRRGGYKALELSFSEMYPLNLSLKLGVNLLYSSITASYNPEFDKEFALGVGLGSLLPLSEKIFFNPEFMTGNSLNDTYQQFYRLTTNLNFRLHPKWHFSAGPSLLWNHRNLTETFPEPLFSLYEDRLDSRNRLIIGFRIGLIYNISSH